MLGPVSLKRRTRAESGRLQGKKRCPRQTQIHGALILDFRPPEPRGGDKCPLFQPGQRDFVPESEWTGMEASRSGAEQAGPGSQLCRDHAMTFRIGFSAC